MTPFRHFVLLFGLSSAASGQAKVVSDAQVEANVLKALASAPDLASEAVTTRTVYGVVTLSGSVRDEKLRVEAENLAANAVGVRKVIDELTLGAAPTASAGEQQAPAPQEPVPAPIQRAEARPQRNNPDADRALDQQAADRQSADRAHDPSDSGAPDPRPAPVPELNRRPISSRPGPQRGPYGYPPAYSPAYSTPVDGGQLAGQTVTVPDGTLVRIRVSQRLSSSQSQPDTVFDGIVVNDVVAGGAIAIPRGAAVQGRVVAATSSGLLKGRGEITLQLTRVILAAKSYPIVSDEWKHHGGDKTVETINKTAGFGALGALVGAAAGRGVGAAVGGGIGAAAGLGSSAASGNGQVDVPSEAVLTFHLTQAATVQTVSEQEMQRLAYGVPAVSTQQYAPRRRYPEPYYAPYGPAYGYPYRYASPYRAVW